MPPKTQAAVSIFAGLSPAASTPCESNHRCSSAGWQPPFGDLLDVSYKNSLLPMAYNVKRNLNIPNNLAFMDLRRVARRVLAQP